MKIKAKAGTADSVTKKALGGVVAFYLIIAFEIVCMAGPFAVYFYGVYNPVLNFFDRVPASVYWFRVRQSRRWV